MLLALWRSVDRREGQVPLQADGGHGHGSHEKDVEIKLNILNQNSELESI